MVALPHAEYLASLPRTRVITSALITQGSRVLCVEPTYKPTWHLPGGTVEPGESVSVACLRECDEELGVRVQLGRLLAVGLLPAEDDDPHGCLAFVHAAALPEGTSLADLVVPADELHGVHWLDRAERQARLSPNASCFVTAGLAALAHGTVVEFDR